ncbi:hypothetical protein GM418_22200 [Maribellus comscasis]|uniref:Uncharacterized protein n=1 Tax=Maribellus comscasis TaxID=2681766 RepID=A0A6I6K8A0_9BACT|nr:hypothetical protein [Maribellus comscasis]QGY46274.1 hypothetical protein GM418_22200 [Maribellus comscasis]
MKHFIPFAFFLFVFVTTNAQFENIDLSAYKLPEIKIHQLDFSLQYNNDYSQSSHGNSIGNSSEFSRFKLNNNFDALYSYYLNSKKVQIEGLFDFSADIELDWQKSGDVPYEKNDDYIFTVNAWLARRMYLNSKDKWFFLWSPNLYIRRYSYFIKELEGYDNEKSDKFFSRNLDFQPEIKLGGGFGRIEPVNDLRKAIYIFEDLLKNDRLTRLPNENEILQVTDKIAQLRNQRFFDSRLRSIYEIKSLDSLLGNLGLTDEMDATYFTSLNDMWLNGNESIHSGTRIQFSVSGKLLCDFGKTRIENYVPDSEMIVNENSTKYYNNLWGLELLFDSYKPIGLNWQRYFSTNFYYNKYYPDMNENPLAGNYNVLIGSFIYGYSWFLNTRTSAYLGSNGQFNFFDYLKNDENHYDSNNAYCSLSGNLSYYFSPRLRASFFMAVYYSWSESIRQSHIRGFSFTNHIGINYAIF